MATYNKPGVYIEETLTPLAPTAGAISDSVAAFIGIADRGPTASVNGNVVGVPTLVTNWNEFVNNFGYGANTNIFSGIPSLVLTGATSSGTTVTLVGSTTERLKVGSVISIVSGAGTLPSTPVVVTAVTSASTFTVNQAFVDALSGSTVSATPNSDLKYAVKSFFDNGGSQAYVLRDVNPDATTASVTFRDQNASTALSASLTYSYATTGAVTITATSGTPFADFSAGKVVSFASVPGDFAALNGKKWVVSAVATNSRALTVAATFATAPATATATTPITITGGAKSNTNALRIKAKGAGAWGNGVWVGIYPNVSENYFDLHVYHDVLTDAASDITANDRVERFTALSMDPANDRYVGTAVNSAWITVEVLNPTGTGIFKLPEFTGAWSTADGVYNLNSVTKEFAWNASGFTSTPIAVKLGGSAVANSNVTSAVSNGSDGGSYRTAANVIARLDSVTSPVLINWPANAKTADVNALLTYAAGRKDAFVIVDAANDLIVNVLGTITDKGILSYTSSPNYGAAYYPYISIPDPTSTTGKTVSIPPGGAVAAIYSLTDASRGVFKAPAGVDSIVRNAVAVATISNDEFNLIANNAANLNVIRFVPGSGICVMGARTLSNQFVDRYVPIRRTLNYLGSNLKSITEFAVFEPNDPNLWGRVSSVASAFLNDFWRRGGLAGSTADQAFYVKCDSSINTPSTISSGELNIEVGVALQKPAEFVIIRIGQLDGGATVTTSI